MSDTVALATAAAITRRIELISSVLLAATWPAPLLAKELAGIDGVSGGRLTIGLGVGQRPDDFVVEGYGREGSPRLIALAYLALGDGDAGRRNVYDYYSIVGSEIAEMITGAVCDSPAKVRETISSFADIGVEELSFIPGTDDTDEVKRLADIVS